MSVPPLIFCAGPWIQVTTKQNLECSVCQQLDHPHWCLSCHRYECGERDCCEKRPLSQRVLVELLKDVESRTLDDAMEVHELKETINSLKMQIRDQQEDLYQQEIVLENRRRKRRLVLDSEGSESD